jgi:acetyl esterase/lipase
MPILVFLAALVAAMSTPQPPRSRTFAEVAAMPNRQADARVTYGSAPEQFGELRLPSGTGPHPVVVLIHGGCWRAEYDIAHIAPLATALADEGWAVWAIEYRRVGSPGGGWPGTFRDVGAAIDHLRTLANTHPLDLSRIVGVGHSAGGHLALWSATRGILPDDSPIASRGALLPHGVVALAGIADLATYASPNGCGSAVVPLMGGTPDVVADRYAHASPVALVPQVPVQLVVGTADTIVPRTQADAFVKASGNRSTVRVVEGAGHFDLIAPDRDAWSALREAVHALTSRTQPGPAVGQVRGRVFDEQGGSIPDASVVFQPLDPRSGLTEFGATADARGRFDFEGVRTGTYRVTSRARGYEVTVAVEEVRPGVQTEVTLTMRAVK